MRGLTIGSIALTCLALTAGTAILVARAGQQSRPGEIGESHVLVDNRYPEQAIPVIVQRNLDPLRVQVTGTHPVTIDPSTVMSTRAVRQPWEYRTITVTGDKDPAGFLANAGLDGWEAVGLQSAQGGVAVLLKRPR
jgi:hypothetical protein